MFIKYLTNSIKNNPLWYILTVLCEIALLLIFFCANAIMLNSLANNSNIIQISKEFSFRLNETLTTSKDEDKRVIDSFFDNIEGITSMALVVATGTDSSAYYSLFPTIRAFGSYEDMVSFYEKYHEIDESNLPTRRQYENGEKVVIVGNAEYNFYEDYYAEFRYSDDNHILVGPDDVACTVTGYAPNASGVDYIYGCEPDNMQIYMMQFELKDIPQKKDIEQIKDFIQETFGGKLDNFLGIPEPPNLSEIRKNGANILLSALMLVLIAFNISLIFKQAAQRRKKEFAVFRFCGFSQKTGILYFLAEALILSAFSSLASCLIFEYAVKSKLSEYYGMAETMFTPDYYFLLAVGYMAVTALLFALCIVPSAKKSIAGQFCSL